MSLEFVGLKPDLGIDDCPPSPVMPIQPRAMLMDCSHDNETPSQKRTLYDQLPNACLVSASVSAIGSVAGYDIFVPNRLDVVKEKRKYQTDMGYVRQMTDDDMTRDKSIPRPTTSRGGGKVRKRSGSGKVEHDWVGMAGVRAIMNRVHLQMSREKYNEVYVSRPKDNIVLVHRHSPYSEQGYIFLAHTCYKNENLNDQGINRPFGNVAVPGIVTDIVLCARMADVPAAIGKFAADRKHINGIPADVIVHEQGRGMVTIGPVQPGTHDHVLSLDHFPPGSILIAKVDIAQAARRASCRILRSLMSPLSITLPNDDEIKGMAGVGLGDSFSLASNPPSLEVAVSKLGLNTLNILLFRSQPEEAARRDLPNCSTYNVPGYGNLFYAGLAGFIPLLNQIRKYRDMGHSLCENLRQGNWVLDYIVSRINQMQAHVPHDVADSERPKTSLPPSRSTIRLTDELLLSQSVNQPIAIQAVGLSRPETSTITAVSTTTTEGPNPLASLSALSNLSCLSELSALSSLSKLADLDPRLEPLRQLENLKLLSALAELRYLDNLSDLGLLRSKKPSMDQLIMSEISVESPKPSPSIDERQTETTPLSEGDALKVLNSLAVEVPDQNMVDDLLRWFEWHFTLIKRLPRFLVPKYFDLVITRAYGAIKEHALRHLFSQSFIRKQGTFAFARDLAVTLLQLYSYVNGAPLLYLCPKSASMAAGLPHFASGYMRSWGRDTFISVRGLCLLTGRFDAARSLLVSGLSLVRHGLVPNLFDGGNRPRYNCRDAVWWMLTALQDYCEMSPEGYDFLSAPIIRLFPYDEQQRKRKSSGVRRLAQAYHDAHLAPTSLSSVMVNGQEYITMSVGDVIHEIMQKHATGIDYVEWEAGPAIDDKMQGPGFHIKIGVDAESGMVFGGNRYNCGTWMDKMGESLKTGNWGWPATPRDGAAIEIVSMVKRTVTWLAKLTACGAYPHEGVYMSDSASEWLGEYEEEPAPAVTEPPRNPQLLRVERQSRGARSRSRSRSPSRNDTYPRLGHIPWQEWSRRIKDSFESCFYIPFNNEEDADYDIHVDGVFHRGVYKDTHGSFEQWRDLQLRPNQLIAMVMAPELFTPSRVVKALEIIEKYLWGPLGMKTLAWDDHAYRGSYDSGDDSDDGSVAKGFNYHQGPEWLWPKGFYIRARLRFPPVGQSVSEMYEICDDI